MSSSPDRYVLPFQKGSTEKVEAAAVLALAELERRKGSGLIVKQPEEKLSFFVKAGYPLWIFPKNDRAFIFDGMNNSSYTVIYSEVPSAKQLTEKLETNMRPLENYLTFLSSYGEYFQKSLPKKQFTLKGLIGDLDFQNEFKIYCKEAVEVTDETTSNFSLIQPILNEETIANTLHESDSLQSELKEEADNLPESIKLIKKTTNTHKTEIEYQSAAAVEEIDARIKAQSELINPQIAEINKNYKQKNNVITKNFNKEIKSLQNICARKIKLINKTLKKIQLYEKEAKAQEEKNHLFYERRWREKIKRTESELNTLKKERKNLENNIEKLNKQKVQEIFKIKLELESEVNRLRHSIVDLEAERKVKINYYRKQNLKMIDLETPVIEGLNRNLRSWDSIKSKFEDLCLEERFDRPALFYLPYYLACFEVNEDRRWLIVPPSTIGYEDFSTKLKGALGISKIKRLLIPRFKSITSLLRKFQEVTQQNSQLKDQLYRRGKEANLLANPVFQKNVKEGLTSLKQAGWLSAKEHRAVSDLI